MGMVQRDIHKRENSLEQQYRICSAKGVLALLANLHYLRSERLNGDIDCAILLLDFFKAYRETPLTRREREVLYYVYEEGQSQTKTAELLNTSRKTVSQQVNSAAQKIADSLAATEGYLD